MAPKGKKVKGNVACPASSAAVACPALPTPDVDRRPSRPAHVAAETGRVPGASGSWSAARRHALQTLCPTLDPGSFAINAPHWSDVEDAWGVINASPVFQGLAMEHPYKIAAKGRGVKTASDGSAVEGSHIEPFAPESYVDAMATRGVHTCGGNLMWATPFYTPMPGAPINRRAARYQAFPCQTRVATARHSR